MRGDMDRVGGVFSEGLKEGKNVKVTQPTSTSCIPPYLFQPFKTYCTPSDLHLYLLTLAR